MPTIIVIDGGQTYLTHGDDFKMKSIGEGNYMKIRKIPYATGREELTVYQKYPQTLPTAMSELRRIQKSYHMDTDYKIPEMTRTTELEELRHRRKMYQEQLQIFKGEIQTLIEQRLRYTKDVINMTSRIQEIERQSNNVREEDGEDEIDAVCSCVDLYTCEHVKVTPPTATVQDNTLNTCVDLDESKYYGDDREGADE